MLSLSDRQRLCNDAIVTIPTWYGIKFDMPTVYRTLLIDSGEKILAGLPHREETLQELQQGYEVYKCKQDRAGVRPVDFPFWSCVYLHLYYALSRTERTVLAGIASGQTNQAIADTTFTSRSTIANHIRSIFRKFCLSEDHRKQYSILNMFEWRILISHVAALCWQEPRDRAVA